MTTFNGAKEAVAGAFLTAWNDRTPVQLDNEEFDTTSVKDQTGTGDDNPWVRLAFRHTGANQETLGGPGNRKFQRFGQAIVTIYTARDIGSQTADNLTQDVLDIFEGLVISGTTVYFTNVVPTEVGVLSGSDWYIIVVTALFTYDELK